MKNISQEAAKEMIRAMRSVLEEEEARLETLRRAPASRTKATDVATQLTRAQTMHDGFASTLRRLAPDNYSATVAINSLGGYPD
jgi:exonuclease VII large subunit